MSFKDVLDTITEKQDLTSELTGDLDGADAYKVTRRVGQLKLKIKEVSKELNTLQDAYKKLTGKTYQW